MTDTNVDFVGEGLQSTVGGPEAKLGGSGVSVRPGGTGAGVRLGGHGADTQSLVASDADEIAISSSNRRKSRDDCLTPGSAVKTDAPLDGSGLKRDVKENDSLMRFEVPAFERIKIREHFIETGEWRALE